MINDLLKNKQPVAGWQKPQIFDLTDNSQRNEFEKLLESDAVQVVSDCIEDALSELFDIEYPAKKDSKTPKEVAGFIQKITNGERENYGVWVYYPWNSTVVHFPPEADLRKLRGSRNRNLITDAEREALVDNKTILILGLSVGSNAVDSLLMQGIGSQYILVDMDQLDPTNLNRLRASYDQLGIHKVDIVAKKVSELDPYLKQVHYKNGLNEENLEEILDTYKPDIIIDEMDSLRMKIITRQRAKALGIPVLMATDDGDDILLDIERYDISNDQPILHGILPEDIIEAVLHNQTMSRQEMGAIIGRYFVNLENVPVRMIESLMEVGKTLPSWPQLGGAAVLSGLYLAYAAKRILLGQPLNDGRFLMGPETQLNPELTTRAYQEKKSALIEKMMQSNTV